MPETLNAGYYLQYLWEKRDTLDQLAGFDLAIVRRTLASFHLATYQSPTISPPAQHKSPAQHSAVEGHILAVYRNLLQRGLPTLAPLRVERSLTTSVSEFIPFVENKISGTYCFEHGRMNHLLEQDWLEGLVNAHLTIDPRLHPTDHRADHFDLLTESTTFGSKAERDFYTYRLPKVIGLAATQRVELQRPLATILPREKAQASFKDQRVDFALELGALRVVYEVDGPCHLKPGQKKKDKDRDEALLDAGWRTVRIPTSELGSKTIGAALHAGLPTDDLVLTRLNRIYAKPLWTTPLGRAALTAVLGPFGVARIQRALLWALEKGHLHLDQPRWRLVIVERDVRVAALAVADFMEHLAAFYRLWQLDNELPKIELWLYHTAEFASLPVTYTNELLTSLNLQVKERSLDESASLSVADFVDGDLLIDTALLQPEGFQRLEAGFINRHLTNVGIAVELRSSLSPYDTRRLATCTPLAYPVHPDFENSLLFFLRNIARKVEFHDGQVGILARALALKPVIGLLPTGGGKSLCYQLSALLQPGLTLVIAPLNSLTMDQADNLRERLAIDWVEYISGQHKPDVKEHIQQRMTRGELWLLLLSPERLQNRDFRAYLHTLTSTIPIPYAVIDEAHCVSEWGHDFRTSYLKLAPTIRAQCKFGDYTPAIMALTGTASFAVLSDVQREIGVEDESAKVYPKSLDRPELTYRIVQVPSKQKAVALRRIMQRTLDAQEWDTIVATTALEIDPTLDIGVLAKRAGWIIFVPHTNGKYGVMDVRESILSVDPKLRTEIYSGRKPNRFAGDNYDTHKINVQRSFKANEFPILISTKAFGMGVDKPNVRYTIHYNMSQSLESYYQEAGRAGRDRKRAECWLIFSDDYPEEADQALHPDTPLDEVKKIAGAGHDRGDVQRLLFLQQQSFPGIEQEFKTIENLVRSCLLPHMQKLALGDEVEVTVPFGHKEETIGKAIYRLSVLNFVKDYTVDYGARCFSLILEKVPDTVYIHSLQMYIQRYKTRDISESVAAEIEGEPANTVLGKCVSYLLSFVYREVERKRRVAIQSMVEVARRALAAGDRESASVVLRKELLAYLEQSVFTEPLEQLARRLEPKEWIALLEMPDEIGTSLLRSVDGVRQLIGGCRRTLESYPDHPGLLFLSSLARLLLAAPEIEVALGEVKQLFAALQKTNSINNVHTTAMLLNAYHRWLLETNNSTMLLSKIADIALKAIPSRPMARAVYVYTPQQSKNILLNLTLGDLRRLTNHLHG